MQHEFHEFSAQQLFRQFDNLKTIELLTEISISLQLDGGKEADISYFSDGQFQSVYIYAITELYKDKHCITLLDEPDSFLHPEWQFDFLKQVSELSEEAAKNNHVLMSSHSAATLCGFEKEKISQFKIDNSTVCCVKQSKKEAIHELSGSYIQYSEDESKLLIDNVIRSSNRPILFVEGPTDVHILNVAHKKLYPNEDITILIHDAFNRGFIRTLFSRSEIFNAYPNKSFFALFDFDDAYQDWRSLIGQNLESDISRGLCKKLTGKKGYSFLLPIPNNTLRSQVWDENNPIEKVMPNPHFCIEHVFWHAEGLESWFRKDVSSGCITFKGDKHKVRFAKEIVPNLASECFEPFRPMFELIKATITTA
ncbi:ATP-dependent nuclease [Agitococcus lubricus]|uniref:ATP-dependent nuclease n=1 Tax=Agitococcus lubricus TaxID=1077255 RepID=UPI003B847CB4